jgi:translocator protein
MAQECREPQRRSKARDGAALVGFVILCFSAAALGALSPPGDWYRELAKPSWNPPAWVFGPVWTLLYLGMAVAGWRVWRRGQARLALFAFGVQLVLNAAWSPIFFGAHALDWALAEILCLLAAILWTTVLFFRRDCWAGMLFVPYAMWVGFASFLNATLWRLNA